MAKIIDSLVSDAVKRFVMNPEYMRAAWMREMENNILFGMTTDEMLVRGLGRDSHQLPHFAGVHVFPVFPGAAAQCVPSPTMLVAVHPYTWRRCLSVREIVWLHAKFWHVQFTGCEGTPSFDVSSKTPGVTSNGSPVTQKISPVAAVRVVKQIIAWIPGIQEASKVHRPVYHIMGAKKQSLLCCMGLHTLDGADVFLLKVSENIML